ncbi:MAG: dockerin type I repeat-containing protein [candidate division Zixibacteria bacterium]|nr:dockerin type I repeat-containing protein [candidate division Zixibacteria bacterium]
MTKRIVLFIEVVILLVIVQITAACAQECNVYIRSNHYPGGIDRDGLSEFQVPIIFGSNCRVWGIFFEVRVDPPASIRPIDIDTVGGVFSYWEDLHCIPLGPNRLRIWGMCNHPSHPHEPLDSAYEALVCNVIYDFGCGYQTCQTATIYLDSVRIIDDDCLWYDVGVSTGGVVIGPDVTGTGFGDTTLIQSGDVNCDDMVLGADIVRLVNYFRGNVDCPCSKCAGDANGDGYIIGADVTYMVRYFRGEGPEPATCEFIPCE